MQHLFLSKKQLETIGTFSIQGLLAEKGIIPSDDKDLEILFETFDLAQRIRNDGPDSIIVPEYVPLCLMESAVALTKQGYNLTFNEFHSS